MAGGLVSEIICAHNSINNATVHFATMLETLDYIINCFYNLPYAVVTHFDSVKNDFSMLFVSENISSRGGGSRFLSVKLQENGKCCGIGTEPQDFFGLV